MADGEVHSEQELAELLGVSRTAVWKQLRKLEGLGLEVESLKARGYRLTQRIQLLDQSRVEQALETSTRTLLSRLDIRGSVTSTNSIALDLAQQGQGHGVAIVAEHQTGGRGRRGRSWVSPYAANLYLSLIWEFDGGAAALEGLSLAVGVAVVEALESVQIEIGGVSGNTGSSPLANAPYSTPSLWLRRHFTRVLPTSTSRFMAASQTYLTTMKNPQATGSLQLQSTLLVNSLGCAAYPIVSQNQFDRVVRIGIQSRPALTKRCETRSGKGFHGG